MTVPNLRERRSRDSSDWWKTKPVETMATRNLPLHRQGRGAEDQHGAVVQQRRDHGARPQGKRLADSDFISEQQARLPVGLTVLEKHRHERALPRLELLAAAVDGALGERRRRQLVRLRGSETDLDPLGDALDLLDDGVGQGVGVLPERVELLLDPGDALR
jgi:hypothetical protein